MLRSTGESGKQAKDKKIKADCHDPLPKTIEIHQRQMTKGLAVTVIRDSHLYGWGFITL